MQKKFFQFLYTMKILFFIGILVLPSLAWILMHFLYPDTISAMDSKLVENRQKAEFPTAFHPGSITIELEEFYNDHAPFRSLLIRTYQAGNSKLENIYISSIKPSLSDLLYGRGETEEEDMGGYDIGSLFQPASEPDVSEEISEPNSEPFLEEHQYVELSRTEPTCTKPGNIHYECADCGMPYDEIIPVKGHENVYAGTFEPTYTEYGYDLYFCSKCFYQSRFNIVGKLIDTSFLAPTMIGQEVLLGRFGWLFFTGDDSISYYTGSNVLNEEAMKDFLDTAMELDSLCESQNIQLQLMIVPNKSQVYPEFMPSYQIEEGPKREERLVEYFRENSGPSLLYPLAELQATKPYWPVYYNLDTHWNLIGAFIGVQAMYKEMGIPTTNIFDLEVTDNARLGGDLLILAGTIPEGLTSDAEYVLSYKPEVGILESSGDYTQDDIFHCRTTSPNECKMVMVSDSFRINMIPYLIKDFSDSTILHRDGLPEAEDSIKNADVLIFTCVERLDMDFLQSMKDTIKILKDTE